MFNILTNKSTHKPENNIGCLLHSYLTLHKHLACITETIEYIQTEGNLFQKIVPEIPIVTASIMANKLSLCSFQSAERRDVLGDRQQSTKTSNWNVLVFK